MVTEAEAVGVYPVEQFTDDEEAILRPYFTNLDRPVFGVVNLPEVVKGALFARYSRSPKSLRRLFLDEFVADLDLTGDLTVDATVGLKRAEALYERVFLEYGDDSVAQLGGVHLACEQASNMLTKILEWGRVMSYMEQSTRYIPYDGKLGGRYRYYRDRAVLADPTLAWRYIADLDALFDTYTGMLPKLLDWARERYPKDRRRLRLRLQAEHPREGVRRRAWHPARPPRCRTSASTAAARPSRRCCSACARTRCPRHATYADDDARGAAQGHPVVRRARRPRRSWRGVERVPRRDADRDVGARPPPLRRRQFPSRARR